MPVEAPVLLYGAGREARSTRAFIDKIVPGAEVHVTVDSGDATIESAKTVSPEQAAANVEAGYYKTIVRSPGVSIYKPLLTQARDHGINVTTNVNLWGEYKRGDTTVIAITGTKGKSTTSKLVHTMLVEGGRDAGLAGNIGVPLLDSEPHDIMVLELSSFQCADLTLNPDFIGLTSLFPEHLDWHQGPENYFRDKLNILRRTRPYFVAATTQARSSAPMPQPVPGLVKMIPMLTNTEDVLVSEAVAKSRLMGAHNLENARLAARLSLAAGLDLDDVLRGIDAFEPLRHRLQMVEFGGKRFVNDSIATNPEATKAAIAAFPGERVHVIVGGYDRGQNYDDLARFLTNAPISAIWFLPDTGTRIADMLPLDKLAYEVHRPANLKDLFAELRKSTDQFECLILSPGAPSYNQFDNFEQRGDTFLKLAEEHFG